MGESRSCPIRNRDRDRYIDVSEPTDPELATWLAAETDTELRQVESELEIGERRRSFVVDELTEAGFAGPELQELVMRLTGIDASTAQALIAARGQRDRGESDEAQVPRRDERLARNEILFRRLNERLSAAEDTESGSPELRLVCECSDRDCVLALTMEPAEYEWLRQNPHRFAVLPGHEAPAVEDVVERHPGFVIVEKHAETHDQVEAADPRL